MLSEYSFELFPKFQIKQFYKIDTFILQKTTQGENYRKPIRIEFKVVPKFHVVQDKSGNLTPRIIYWNKIENVECGDSDFDPEKFALKLNYQA